jgi:alpha-glucoside transport system substrate-binding protein
VLEVFVYHRAAMVVAPDFAESVIRHFGVPDGEVGTFTFPGTGPLVFGGDLLVLTDPATEEARQLVDRLGRPEAPVAWIRDTGGFIAGHPGTGAYSPTLHRLSAELRAGDVRFDLTDELGVVGGGLDRVLVDFLRDLGDGVPRAEAARTACAAMVNVDESG